MDASPKHCEEICYHCGISPDVLIYWLRHSHDSHALDRGASLDTVRDTLGHSSIPSDESLYSRQARPEQRSAPSGVGNMRKSNQTNTAT